MKEKKLFRCSRTGIEADTMQELIERLQLEILALREEVLERNKTYLMQDNN